MANDDSRSPEPKLSECCISHVFHKAALKSPDKVAVVHASGGAKIISQDFDNNHVAGESLESGVSMPPQPPVYEGDRCFTYSEILRAVDSLSTRLRRALDGGSLVVISENKYTPRIVGIYMEPSVEYIVSVLTVLRCGEAFMPLDPSWPRERILSVVSSSRAELIIGCECSGEDSYFHRLDNLHWLVNSGCCPVLSMSMSDCVKEQSKVCDLQWHCESEVSRLFCYLMYTSGSTGKPKGVCGTEAGILNRFLWMQDLYPLHGKDCLLFKTSTSFIDHVQEFLSGLLTGSTVVVPPFSELRENILSLIDFLQMYAVNRLVAVPSLMSAVLLPLQSPKFMRLRNHLKVLVLSGEVLHLTLCKSLLKLLPHTDILNLYGSTEVSGDCTYFDCKRLPSIFENETVVTVPIGSPLNNCDVVLIGNNAPRYGEICVRGLCNAAGYFDYPSVTPFNYAEVPDSSTISCTYSDKKPQLYYKTGDFARQLESDVFIFIGREDRTVKFNGQRIALEEIESTLMEHPDIINAAVVCQKSAGEISHIEAHLVMTQREDCNGHLRSSIRSWITNKLPQAVVPSRFIFAESLPISSSGKVDYNKLLGNASPKAHSGHATVEFQDNDPLKVISKVFCDALTVMEVSAGDNFFDMGGNSLSAAYVAYSLGINIKLLYTFPTPLKLQMALQRKIESSDGIPGSLAEVELDSATIDENILPSHSMEAKHDGSKPEERSFEAVEYSSTDHQVKRLKQDTSLSYTRKYGSPVDKNFWDGMPLQIDCSFSRCNRSKHSKADNSLSFPLLSEHVSRGRKGCMQQLWKVHMDSCVDASPLIVCKGNKMFLFIGSHSGKFICVDAKSGFIVWEIKLEGRTECSAAVVDDFSQVVVGCYQGNIYFLRLLDGNICWKFHTGGELNVLCPHWKTATNLPRSLRKLKYVKNFHQFNLTFKRHCKEGKLPNYVVVEQRYFDLKILPGNDDHPSHDVSDGQKFVKEVYEALRSSPQWNEMLFVIIYDEHGGFYDHVPTPVTGVPSPDDIVGSEPYNFKFDRLGVRVPAILISPWIEKGTVLHGPSGPYPTSEFEHSSIPATVKKIFNLKEFLTMRDAWAGTFEGVISRDTPRTDCPETLAQPVRMRVTEANEDAKLTDFQKELVQMTAVLAGDHGKATYPEKLVEEMTVSTAVDYVNNSFKKFLGEFERLKRNGAHESTICSLPPIDETVVDQPKKQAESRSFISKLFLCVACNKS